MPQLGVMIEVSLSVLEPYITHCLAERIIDTPISESAIMGAAAGASLTGLRPIAELMFADFFGVCFDQIYNQAAKFRYMFGNQKGAPIFGQLLQLPGSRFVAKNGSAPQGKFESTGKRPANGSAAARC